MVTDQLRRQGSFAINSSSTSIVLRELSLGRTIEFTDNVAVWEQVLFVLKYILPMKTSLLCTDCTRWTTVQIRFKINTDLVTFDAAFP